jgi:hypothetical protein
LIGKNYLKETAYDQRHDIRRVDFSDVKLEHYHWCHHLVLREAFDDQQIRELGTWFL